jgi:serine phosphatase RsbU (regulator of sigma subunit)/DNA-binding NarL/FixJ family response regulator
MPRPVIVCVDDEKTVLSGLKQELEFGLGKLYEFEIAESAEEGLELVRELIDDGVAVPVIISDQLMPGMKGDELLIHIHKINPNIRKILLTGQASADAVGNALNHAALYRYIGKPWDQADLKLTVERAAESFFATEQMEARMFMLRNLNRNLQQLSRHTAQPPMVSELLDNLLADTGATRGLIITYWQQVGAANTVPHRVYRADAKNPARQMLSSTEWEDDFPLHILKRVEQNLVPLAVGNAIKSGDWSGEPYVARTGARSIYCAPVLKANQLAALLYLEHPTEADFFTAQKLEYLALVINQATIFFDKTALYEDLEEKVNERAAIIVEQNSSLTDSLSYASRIQAALMPDLAQVLAFFRESFALFQPKEIVTGDFYWIHATPTRLFLVVGDSTGTSVPAAFMSVLSNTLLNQLIKEVKLTEPHEILHHMNMRMRQNLKDKAKSTSLEMHEGVGVALLRFDKDANGLLTLHYAGANCPAYLLRGAHIHYLEPASINIGWSKFKTKGTEEQNPFRTHTHPLQAGDMLYLYTDGFPSQLSSRGNVVISQERFLKTLQEIQALPAQAQEQALIRFFDEWRGDQPQTDDILVMGLRV